MVESNGRERLAVNLGVRNGRWTFGRARNMFRDIGGGCSGLPELQVVSPPRKAAIEDSVGERFAGIVP